MIKKFKKRKNLIFIFIIALFILSVPLGAQADDPGYIDYIRHPISSTFIATLNLFIAFMGNVLAFAVTGFTWIIQWQSFDDVTVVTTSWTIVRDFMNMFFILILIIISFGTILDLQNYSINTPGLVTKLIMAALLINFSLAIGGFIIDISNVLTTVFLNTIGDFAGHLGAGLSLNKIFEINDSKILALSGISSDKVITTGGIELLFILFIISILTFSMLVMTFFSFIRIPILWALLIISPAAWVLGILPFSKNASQKWWDYFLGWTFFLPAYLFILAIGTSLLKNRSGIYSTLQQSQGSDTFFSTLNFGMQDLFFWIFTIFLLVSGLKAAQKFGNFASVGASGALISGKGWLERKIGVGSYNIASIKTGAKETAKKIKEEGISSLKIGGYQPFKGERGEKEKAMKVANIFGRPFGFKDNLKTQQEFINNASKVFETLKRQFSVGQIKDQDIIKMFKKDPAGQSGFAAAKMLADQGIMQGSDFINLSKNLIDKNPLALQDLAKTWSGKNFAKAKPEELLGIINAGKTAAYSNYADFANPTALPIRLEIALKLTDEKANKGMLKKMDVETLETALEIVRGPESFEGRRIMKEIGNQRPDLAALYNQRNPRTGVKQRRTMSHMVYDMISKKGAKDLSKVSDNVWENADFKNALQMSVKLLERSEKSVLPARGQKGKKGAGLRFKESLMKQALQNGDRDKFKIVKSLNL